MMTWSRNLSLNVWTLTRIKSVNSHLPILQSPYVMWTQYLWSMSSVIIISDHIAAVMCVGNIGIVKEGSFLYENISSSSCGVGCHPFLIDLLCFCLFFWKIKIVLNSAKQRIENNNK